MNDKEAKKKHGTAFDSTSSTRTEREGHLVRGQWVEVWGRDSTLLGKWQYIGRDENFYIFREEFQVKEFENSLPTPGARYKRINILEIGEINDAKPGNVYEA